MAGVDPTTDDDWSKAARAAVVLLALEDAVLFGLVPVNPLNVDETRAAQMIEGALERGLPVLDPNELWAARQVFPIGPGG